MPLNGKRNRVLNFLLKYSFHFILLFSGIFVGFLCSNWSYFEIDKKISVHENFTILISVAVAIFVGNNIQDAITRRQNYRSLLIDEIKRLLTYIEGIETWFDCKTFPFDQSKIFFKKGTIKIQFCRDLFVTNNVCKSNDFEKALGLFNSLKQDILAISPILGGINLTDPLCDNFEKRYHEIRADLLKLLFR